MATELARRIRGTRKEFGKEIRTMFVRASQEECEPLTVGDMQKGDKFIVMPVPGDNDGHGGFLEESHLFIKTEFISHPRTPTNAVRVRDGSHTLLSNLVFVFKID